ncbi:argonaute-like protein [Mycena galericulata]|nr:argonaute-like protein [Mycena galericulata]
MPFQPDIPIANKRERVMHILQTSIAPTVFRGLGLYDGRNLLYLSHRPQFPGGGNGSFTVRLGNANAPVGSPGVYEVIISRTASETIRPTDVNKLISASQTADRKTATATNLLQLIVRQDSNQNNPTNNGRAYFSPKGKKLIEGTGIELWRGYFQSVRPTLGRMLVTIDTSMAAVYQSGPLLNVAMSVLGTTNARDLVLNKDRDLMNFRKLQAHLKNRLIKTTTTDRTKTIRALVCGPIGRYPFQKDGKPTTIAEHFYRAYNITLNHPETFGVRISGSNAPFEVIVPAELCTILEGQLYKKRLPANATDAAVSFATMQPRARLDAIVGGTSIPSPIHGYSSSEYIHDAGMVINPQPMILDARLLDPPDILFGGQKRSPRNGAWNVLGQQFRKPKSMIVWGYVNLESKLRNDAADMMKVLGKCCLNLGMTVDPPTASKGGDPHSAERVLDSLVQEIQLAHQNKAIKIDMIIVLLPSKAEEIRNRVKFWGDVKHGIRTSCLREDKLRKALDQYRQRNDSQLNARLGGQYALPESRVLRELQKLPFMIMGIDVSHAGAGSNRPSIASLVWSWDAEATSYIAYSEVQAPRTEIVQGLKNMVKRALREFAVNAKRPPARIVVYRDGVSEGEQVAVKDAEIEALKTACREVWREAGEKGLPLPTLSFIVVVKRHHVVFFPNDNAVNDGKTGNCRAGLVVDALQSPLAPGFHLQSHAPIKGTARSGKYAVLLDENFNNDISVIQQLSFELCHVYAKATRAISIPAPVYYADIVCARAKFHFDPSQQIDFDASTNASGSEEFDLEYWRSAYRPVCPANLYDKSMYFL